MSVCKRLHDVLRAVHANYAGTGTRLFKDFRSNSPPGRALRPSQDGGLQQDPTGLLENVLTLIYDNQEIISAANAWTQDVRLCGSVRVKRRTFKTCDGFSCRSHGPGFDGRCLQLLSATHARLESSRRLTRTEPHSLTIFWSRRFAGNDFLDCP